jgi:glycerol-3-phosphate dehydrogenase
VRASAEVHVTFPNHYSPRSMGLLDLGTPDCRVTFFLPWREGNTIVTVEQTVDRAVELLTLTNVV